MGVEASPPAVVPLYTLYEFAEAVHVRLMLTPPVAVTFVGVDGGMKVTVTELVVVNPAASAIVTVKM
jgi:hypothetical protein